MFWRGGVTGEQNHRQLMLLRQVSQTSCSPDRKPWHRVRKAQLLLTTSCGASLLLWGPQYCSLNFATLSILLITILIILIQNIPEIPCKSGTPGKTNQSGTHTLPPGFVFILLYWENRPARKWGIEGAKRIKRCTALLHGTLTIMEVVANKRSENHLEGNDTPWMWAL